MPPEEGSPAAAAATEPNGAGAGAAPAGTAEQAVPYSRFQSVNTELRNALEKHKAYETELANLRVQAGQADTFRAQAEAAAKKYDSHMAIGRVLGGLPDQDVVELIADRFERLPETERAAGMAPVLEGWKADPSKAPPSVRPHFTPPPDAARNAAGNTPPATPARPPVDPHRSVVQTPNPPQGAPDPASMSLTEWTAYSNAQRAARGLPLHPTK
jgi:predicted metallopeptidase